MKTADVLPPARQWPRHHEPFLQRVLRLRLRIDADEHRTVVTIPASPVLVLALVPACISFAGSAYLAYSTPFRSVATIGLLLLLCLPLILTVLLMARLAFRFARLESARLPEVGLTIIRQTLRGPQSETFRRGQVDSLRIAEKRDHRGRRHFSLDLLAEDGYHREILRGFPPADLERAAQALRAALAWPTLPAESRSPDLIPLALASKARAA